MANGDLRLWTHSPYFRTFTLVNHEALKLLGKRIRERRKTLGLTQEQLADKAGIDRSYIGGVERGIRNLTFTVLCQICSALDGDVAAMTHDLPDVAS